MRASFEKFAFYTGVLVIIITRSSVSQLIEPDQDKFLGASRSADFELMSSIMDKL